MTLTPYSCIGCGRPVRPRQSGVLREVSGWVEPRTGGGINHVAHPVPTGRFVHKACLRELDAEQPSLFGDG
jgi:hypothetical protein